MTHGFPARGPAPRVARVRLPALVAALFAVGLFAGCASGRSAQQTVGGWFDRLTGEAPTEEGEPRPSYAGASRTQLHREPDASSEVVGELALHEAVLRYQDDRDFAYVKSSRNGVAGWARARQLIDRLPAARPKAPPAAPPVAAPDGGAEAAGDAKDAAAEALPGTDPTAPAGEAPAPERSIFDPY